MSLRYADVEVRCDGPACGETTWLGVGCWNGQLDPDELEAELAEERWTADEGTDRHYCPRCAPRPRPAPEEPAC